MKEIRRRLQIFLALFLLVALAGTFGFMALERLSFIDAFYYNIATMSTVGYGDIHPTNEVSRVFAILLIIMGGATFFGVVANGTELMLLRREQQERLKKVNMVLGVFFSEIGNRLLAFFAAADPEIEGFRHHLVIQGDWAQQNFRAGQTALLSHLFTVEMAQVDLPGLRALLAAKRDFLVRLLENPVLIEHEEFAETLLAIFHLAEELAYRDDLSHSPAADLKHLAGDIRRAYQSLVLRWLLYMEHQKEHYPYLFSLALRVNPFDPQASPVLLL